MPVIGSHAGASEERLPEVSVVHHVPCGQLFSAPTILEADGIRFPCGLRRLKHLKGLTLVEASGFSQRTLLPASNAAIVCSWWRSVGVHTEIRSRSSRLTNSRQSVDVSSRPSCWAACVTRSGR